jgi:general secretion pathway protein M
MEKIRILIAEVQARFQQLSERERRLVAIAGAAVAIVMVFVLLFSFSTSARGYQRRTEDKLRKLSEAQRLAANYREVLAARENLERQLTNSNVSLLRYIEEKATAAGLTIPSMSPKGDIPLAEGRITENGVEIMLPDTTISKLINFLTSVERGPGIVKVKYLRMEPRLANQTLTAWMTISTYRMKQQ